jgi:hypothetical protein
MENIHEACHARTKFYPDEAWQFLEAVLNIPEKLRGLARTAVGDRNARRSNGRRRATDPAEVACAPLNSDET